MKNTMKSLQKGHKSGAVEFASVLLSEIFHAATTGKMNGSALPAQYVPIVGHTTSTYINCAILAQYDDA
jgi:hypothetical protein